MKIKKIIYYFLISMMITSVFMSIMILIKPPKSINRIEIISPSEKGVKVKKNTEISQYLQSQMDDINQIFIHIGNITGNAGIVKVNVYKGDKLLDVSTKEITQLNQNQHNIFEFNNLKNIKNEVLRFEIISDSEEMELFTNKKYSKNQYLLNGNNKLEESLTLIYMGEQKNVSYIWYFMLSLTVSLLLFIFVKEEIKEKGAK